MRRSAAAGVVALALATGLAGQSRFQVVEKTIDDIHASMKSGNVTARQLIQAYLDRVDTFDKKGPAINCIITLNSQALDEADKLDAAYKRSGFAGMPPTSDARTTCRQPVDTS